MSLALTALSFNHWTTRAVPPIALVFLFLGSDSGCLRLLRLQAPERVPHLQSPGSLQKNLFHTVALPCSHTCLGPGNKAWLWRPSLPGPNPSPVPPLTLAPPAAPLLTRLSLLTTLAQAGVASQATAPVLLLCLLAAVCATFISACDCNSCSKPQTQSPLPSEPSSRCPPQHVHTQGEF